MQGNTPQYSFNAILIVGDKRVVLPVLVIYHADEVKAYVCTSDLNEKMKAFWNLNKNMLNARRQSFRKAWLSVDGVEETAVSASNFGVFGHGNSQRYFALKAAYCFWSGPKYHPT